MTPPIYTDPMITAGMNVKALDVSQLRDAVTGIECLKFDVKPDVPAADLASIKAGIAAGQTFLMAQVGGDIPFNVQLGITVKVVATGLGNQDPGGGGACCTGLDLAGARPFFDLKHPNWLVTSGRFSVNAEREKTVAHEYTHGWAWSLGGISIHSQPLGDWLNEGLAEYIAYSTMVSAGQMPAADVDAFMLSSAIATGEAARCLSFLENSNQSGAGLWPGHVGCIAVKKLVAGSPTGILAIRVVNQDIGSGMTFDQAFHHAFGISRTDFYAAFPAYLASLGGPQSCT